MTETKTITAWPTLPDGRWLVLRTCDVDMKAHGGFTWPTEGTVEAPDWDPDPDRDCGGGLHGLLWGCGDGSLLSAASDARWLLVAVDPADVANPEARGKVRFRSGEVVRVGGRDEVVAELCASGAVGLPVAFAVATSGDWGTSTSGYRGTSTSGDGGIVVVRWWDHDAGRYRLTVGYPGEDGIEANVPYRCDERGRLVRADGAS